MPELLPQIGLALEAFKSRQQDIVGLGQRAYKDLFAAANIAMLTSLVQRLIQESYAQMVTANPSRTSLLAAVSQHHTEIIAGCRVLTQDDGILRALTDAANAAATAAFQMIYSESPKSAVPSRSIRSKAKTGGPEKRQKRAPRPAKNTTRDRKNRKTNSE